MSPVPPKEARVGLISNLRLLFSPSLLERMLSLERRQELLEDYTDQKLDSMKSYSLRVGKRERDEAARGPRKREPEEVNGVASTGYQSPRVAALVARRARRVGSRQPDFPAG